MRPNATHGAWIVTLRFDRADRAAVTRAAADADGMGGYALLLQPRTGNALGAVEPRQLENGRVVVEDLPKSTAWDLVSAYVTAATQR